MADISSYTRKIKNASPGEEVRDALIDVLKLLNNMGGDVSNLNGHPASYFAKYQDMQNVLIKVNEALGSSMKNDDAVPTNEGNERYEVLTSGQIYKAVDAISDILEEINHPLSPIDDLMKNIKAVESAKKAIGNAIYNRNGGKVSKEQRKNFEKYPDYIRHIQSGDNIEQIVLDAHENSKPEDPYEANKGNESYNRVRAYKEANVNVSFKTTTLSTSYNNTYDATKEGFVGYKEINVTQSSTASGGGRSGGGGSGANNIDENGIIDSVTIEENGPHSPENGVGWRSVNVDVKDPEIDFDALFEVNFYDCDPATGEKTGAPLDTQHCTYNGSCVFAGTEPTHTGLYFAGWNPPPYRIHTDTDCVAVFTDQAPGVEEIQDSWDDIIACQGSRYGIGSYKTLQLNGMNSIRMQKVYSGEDISTSTWLAMDMLSTLRSFDNQDGNNWNRGTGHIGWSGCNLRKWLNNDFLNNNIPANLRSAIIDVTKTSYEFSYDLASKYISSVKDKIWIPSYKEVLGDLTLSTLENRVSQQYSIAASYYFYANGHKSGGSEAGYGAYQTDVDSITTEYNGIHYGDIYPSWGEDISHHPAITKGGGGYAATDYGWATRTVALIRYTNNQNSTRGLLRSFRASGGSWYQAEGDAETTRNASGIPASFYHVIGFCL